jgi:hypothetical protein
VASNEQAAVAKRDAWRSHPVTRRAEGSAGAPSSSVTSMRVSPLRTVARHSSCFGWIQEDTMPEQKKVTETKTKTDIQGNPKEQKTTTKETRVDSSGNKQKTKTEDKVKR